jgi:hypothetical protein
VDYNFTVKRMKLATSREATVTTTFIAMLVIASLCSTIIMQTNNAAASNVIFKQKIRGEVAVVQKTIKEGNTYTEAGQEIAEVEMTGYTYLPHLHFQVFVFTGPNLWEDYQTLKVDF